MKVDERVCTGRLARWLYRRDWRAVTLPNRRGGITIRFWLAATPDVREHEQIHVRQIRRMGGLRYLLAYGWHWLRIVVRNRGFAGWHDQHPMERE